MNRFSKFGIIAALAGTMAVGTAFAGPIEMVITSGGQSTSLLIGSGDPSTISFNGSLNGWSISRQTGGTSYSPLVNQFVGMDLGGYAVTCVTGISSQCSQDPLTVAISATGFTTPIGPNGFELQFSGNANGGVAYTSAYFDTMNNGNNYFCNDSGSSTLGSLCGPSNMVGSLSLTGVTGGSMLGGPTAGTIRSYSLTVVDTFSANNLGLDPSYSVDTTLVQAPEPGTLAMFGAGLLGCALFINRRRRASRQS